LFVFFQISDILAGIEEIKKETKWYKESCQELQQQLSSEVTLRKIKRQIDGKTERHRDKKQSGTN
jgi:hypothetical protein